MTTWIWQCGMDLATWTIWSWLIMYDHVWSVMIIDQPIMRWLAIIRKRSRSPAVKILKHPETHGLCMGLGLFDKRRLINVSSRLWPHHSALVHKLQTSSFWAPSGPCGIFWVPTSCVQKEGYERATCSERISSPSECGGARCARLGAACRRRPWNIPQT